MNPKTMTKHDFIVLRKELELTQEQFAKELGITTGALRSWEYGINPISPLAEKGINAVAEEIRCRKTSSKQ